MSASIILVGQRGSGLSSFAVIAAQLTGFQVIDVDFEWKEENAASRAACLRVWGEQRYRYVADNFFQELLLRHDQRHVLVCASHAVDPSLRLILRRCSPKAPVIMVNRHMDAVRRHLGLANSDHSTRILRTSQILCRQGSDVEFYNLPEEKSPKSVSQLIFDGLRSAQYPGNRIKFLQHVTQDVARFLSSLGYRVDGSHCLSRLDALESREFPSFTTVHVEDILRTPPCMSDMDCSSDAIELAVSCSEHPEVVELVSEAFQIIKRYHSRPVIYHVVANSTASIEMKRYMELCLHGVRLLPEYVTVDLQCSDEQIASLVATSRKYTQVIGHRTFNASEDFSWKDPALIDQCRRAAALGCHHVRFIRFAMSPFEDRDCAFFQVLANQASNIIVSAACVDRFTRSSAVNSLGLSPVSQPGCSQSDAKQQLLSTAHELNRARFSSFIFQSLHFHVYGASVHHSMSPAMHNAAFELLGLQHFFSPYQSATLDDLRTLVDDTFGGASISLPFKAQVIGFLDSVSEPARIIQAVNTVLPSRSRSAHAFPLPQSNRQKNRAGKVITLHGENTDWAAMRTCIRRRLSAANSVTSSTTALVIGAGGMARAAVYAIMSLGVKSIMIWNRTQSRAQELVDHFNSYVDSSRTADDSAKHAESTPCKFHVLHGLTDRWPIDRKQPSIIVCTPPAHAIGNDPGLDFTVPEHWFGSTTGGVIVELSYQSKSTSLLQQAHEAAHKGWMVVEPLEILIEQGCAQFELFVGQPAPRKEMTRNVIREYLMS